MQNSTLLTMYKSLLRKYKRVNHNVLPKILRNRVVLTSSALMISVSAFQGYYIRQKWLNRPGDMKLDIDPNFPTSGTIIKSKLLDIESKIVEAVQEKNMNLVKDLQIFLEREVASKIKLNAKIKIEELGQVALELKKELREKEGKLKEVASSFPFVEYFYQQLNESLPVRIVNSRVEQHQKQPIKLILVGDSLVCGVGCDKSDSVDGPVMPRILASILSLAFGVDVRWESYGIIGSTVSEIKTKILPQILSDDYVGDINTEHRSRCANGASCTNNCSGEDVEHIVLIICGLNDWKSVFTEFPYGHGPAGFGEQLFSLIDDIKSSPKIGNNSKIFLPAMPFELGTMDEKSSFKIFPLSFFVEKLCEFWDRQKNFLSVDNPGLVTYIDAPKLSKAMKAFSNNVVSPDGVHPSSLGYKFWGIHLAKEIIRSKLNVIGNE